MIRITSFDECNVKDYDEAWAIVRSAKKVPGSYKVVPELSPSEELYKWYLEKKKTLKWCKTLFDGQYVPRFIAEFGREGKDKLNELYRLEKKKKNIALVCFCPFETMCHRSIIAGFLQGSGKYNVVTDTGNDYSYYYRLLLNQNK